MTAPDQSATTAPTLADLTETIREVYERIYHGTAAEDARTMTQAVLPLVRQMLDARPNTLTGEWQYGVRYPDDGTVVAHDEATARRRAVYGICHDWQLVRRHVGAWEEVPTS